MNVQGGMGPQMNPMELMKMEVMFMSDMLQKYDIESRIFRTNPQPTDTPHSHTFIPKYLAMDSPLQPNCVDC